MEVKQVYELVNNATSEVLGESLLQEDLTNVIDVGTAVFNASAVDRYVRSLVNHIGKVIFVNRPYKGLMPSVLMNAWEYGSVLEKVDADLPEAEVNETWELEDRASYDPNIFYKPKIHVKFFNHLDTFEVPISITERQVKQSFSSAVQLNGFIEMVYTTVENALTIAIDALTMRLHNNMIAETLYSDHPDGDYTGTSIKCVNLLALYNARFPSATITDVETAMITPAFIRFAALQMGIYSRRLGRMSRLFNVNGRPRFTPADSQRVVMFSDFEQAANVYLQSDTFHNEFTKFPNVESVPYWQGSGEEYSFEDATTINVKTSEGHEVNASGILAVMYDRNALGINNKDRRTTTAYNAKGEFFNHFHKYEAQYFNDFGENFVVFYVAADED